MAVGRYAGEGDRFNHVSHPWRGEGREQAKAALDLAHVILESRSGSGLLPPQHRPIHQLVRAVAIENYHRAPTVVIYSFFSRSRERSTGQELPFVKDFFLSEAASGSE